MVIIKSIWSGDISLSFLDVPVRLGSRVKDSSPELHQVRRGDGSPVRYRRVAEADGPDGPEVPSLDIVKAYTAPNGSLVMLTPEELKFGYDKRVSVITFAGEGDVPPLSSKSAYWVEPAKSGARAYALLAHSLQVSGKVAIVEFAMRESMSIAVLRAVDGYLAIETLEFDSDLLKPDFAAPANTASEAEQGLMLQMIEGMSAGYDHAAQADRTAEAKMALIQGKIERGEVTAAPARPGGAPPQDLTAMLTAAVEAQKARAAA